MALNSPLYGDSAIQNKKQNIKNIILNNRESNAFACSIKNILIEIQRQSWGAGGIWLVAEADITIQVQSGRYRVLWENVKVSQLEASGHGKNTWIRSQSTLKKKPYSNLIAIIEGSSYRLREQAEKIQNNW